VRNCLNCAASLLKRGSRVKGKGRMSRVRVRVAGQGQGWRVKVRVRVKGDKHFFEPGVYT